MQSDSVKRVRLDAPQPAVSGATSPQAQADRRKGVPWTHEEHRLFLLGLAKFGKGCVGKWLEPELCLCRWYAIRTSACSCSATLDLSVNACLLQSQELEKHCTAVCRHQDTYTGAHGIKQQGRQQAEAGPRLGLKRRQHQQHRQQRHTAPALSKSLHPWRRVSCSPHSTSAVSACRWHRTPRNISCA